MMRGAAAWAGTVAGLSALTLYGVLIHGAIVSGQGTATAAAMALVQVAMTGYAVSRTAPGYRWAALAVAAVLAVVFWQSLRDGLMLTAGVGHAAIHCGLLGLFGGTLLPGREPLVTSMARRIRGSLTDGMVVYTRRVTWAWCGFFAAQLAASLGLFLFAPAAVWSFFVNVLDIPLVAAMFLLEYAYRLRRFRNHSHGSIADVVRVFSERPGRERSPR